ncbi:6420_t:CDS:2, partial [Gigaspora margarita]
NKLLKATIYEACLCELRVNYNIPCRHMLPKEGTVMLSIIPTRWLLFSDRDRPDSNSQEPDLANLKSSDTLFSLKSRLYKIENLAVPAIDLSEVKMPEKIVGKGRPPGTKRLPIAVELIEQLKKKKVKTIKKSIVEVQMICKIFLVESDGNCGFRSLAVAIRENKESWILVKLAMRGQLTKHIEIYRNWLGYYTNLLNQILECRASLCPPSHWFLSSDCAQLAADTFSVPITIF